MDHLQIGLLSLNKSHLTGRTLALVMGTHGSQARQGRGIIKITVVTLGNSQPVGSKDCMVKGIAYGLYLQGRTVTLGHEMPTWFSWLRHCCNKAEHECKKSKKESFGHVVKNLMDVNDLLNFFAKL